MELKHVIPNMEKTFGTLEFAGENKVEQRRINGRMTVVSRSFNLYSDVQTIIVATLVCVLQTMSCPLTYTVICYFGKSTPTAAWCWNWRVRLSAMK